MTIKEWPATLCFIGSGVVAALVYPRLPHSVPVHWGLDGTPDRFGSRLEALLVPLLVCLATAALLWAIGRFSRADRANVPVLRTARLALGALALLLTLAYALEWEMGRAALIGAGLVLTLLGNVMGRTQPSVFVGLRTPWVFLSRRAWFASQRRAALWLTGLGALFMISGALLPPGVLFSWAVPGGVVLSVLGVVVWLTYRSYRDWKEDPSPEPVLER
ncbi:DUF1648 domain-containing protein [Deinococcus aquatilis]|uniref:DUF1648 domain-containing protein n=1 Tax=Deinococcus aquatilis TaxID=519440 RepID=UPI00036BCA84|nr:DUF1648 domain-containing protein [Deinococcus aquatilis]